MYIWILLATIMVALSFFNLAPRADKEHALNEVKAATIVNRFKAEHTAYLHMLECEILYNRSTQNSAGSVGWDGAIDGIRRSAAGPVEVTGYEPAYTSFKTYLPVGYTIGNNRKDGSGTNYSTEQMKHFVYCLADDIEKGVSPSKTDAEVFVACNAINDERTVNIGDHRYMVSFAPIPDRWVTKDSVKTPLPTFVNLLSRNAGSAATFGWLEWDNNDNVFKLHGLGATVSHSVKLKDKDHTFDDANKDFFEQRLDDNYNYRDDLDSSQKHHEKYVAENIIISENSALWRNSALINACKGGNPCMLAFEVFPKTDPACHCYNLLNEAYGGRLNLKRCYNDIYNDDGSKNITNEDKLNIFTEQTYKSRSERYKKLREYLK